ncbi:MAG: arsenate reductase ArsC [Bacteroidales bacterium]
MKKPKVLFLCTGNSARSQMAEAFLRHYGFEQYDAYSAGIEPVGINPFTEKVMGEVNISIEGQYSKNLADYLGREHFSYLITVCSNAEARCPTTFPGISQRLSWLFEDPAAVKGTDEDKMAKFRQVRDQIEEKIKLWLSEE